MQPQHGVTITCHPNRCTATIIRLTAATSGSRNLLWTGLTLQKFDQCRFFRYRSGPRFAQPTGARDSFGFDRASTSENLNRSFA